MPDVAMKGISVALDRVVFRVEHQGVTHRVVLPKAILDDLDRDTLRSQAVMSAAFARHRARILDRTELAILAGRRGDDTFTLFLGIGDFPEI